MAPYVKGSAAYKKKDGTLTISKDQSSLMWLPHGARDSDKALTITIAHITNLQQTPESAAKVMLRIFEKSPEAPEPMTHQFHFNSPTSPRGEANAIKDVLTNLISAIKANDASVPRPNGTGSASAAMAMASAVNSKPGSSASRWYDDAQLKTDIELQQSLMKKDPALHRTYMEARRTKPDTISDSQFNSQFWSTRTNLLRAHAVEINQKRGAYNVLSAVKPRQVDGELKMNLTVDQVQLIFSQHPLVKRVYDENVPKLNETDFWSRFFLSRLFKKLKGERIVEADGTDPTFDRYLDGNNDGGLNQRLFAAHIPNIIDLEGNEENQGGTKSGNRKDFTMRPGSTAKVPIIRTLNSLSEKIMAHVAPSDADPSAPIGMDEETFNSLALRDLQGDAEENRIMLNIKEQSRFFSSDKSSISAEAALYAEQVPAKVLSGMRTDMDPAFMDTDATGGLDLWKAIGVLEDSDSDDDEEKVPHVGSKASLADAQRQILDGVATRRAEIDGSGIQSSLSGLSQKIFERLTLTQATTTEFLHHFWLLFLSGDPDRANELAKMVETLDRAMDRINAVAADAEKEREELIAKQKQHIKDVWQQTGKKMHWNPNSVDGGEKVVKQMMAPTIRTLQKASKEYKKALAAEGLDVSSESIISTGVGSPTSRTPLQPRTSSPSPTSTLKQVRRKNSFLRRVDSSEDYPSPHDSIFEAFYFSGTNSDESNSRIELITLHGHNNLGVTKDDGGNNENREPSMPPISNPVEDAQFRYGHGTVLETITEQRSFGTMRTISRTKSADDMPNFPFLNHRDSFILAKSPRRKQSFSLDDLALINRSYHEACAMIERETCKKCTPPLLEVPEIYAQPMKPLHAPPNRPPTPPGMPSWTAAQNAPPRARRLVYSTPAKLNRFQRFFGLSASDTVHSSRVLPPGNVPSQGRVVSTPVGGRTAPRFRPPRSAYGPIDQHPFSRAPIAKVVIETAPAPPADAPVTELSTTESGQTQVQRKKSKGKRLLGKRVRFTPSATARDSEALALQAAIESTSASAVHPLAQIEAPPQSQVSRTKHACHHYRRSQPQSIVSRIDEIVTPPSINYDDLPSETPPRLQPIGPRQFLSPVSSPNGQNSSSLSLGESLISADLVTDMPTLENRISSVSSTAQLMSGALRSATASPDPLRSLLDAGNPDVNDKASWCWKCKIERSWRKIDRWLVGAASKACFVCCGYDDEDDGSVAYSDNGAVFNPFNSSLRGGAGTSCQRVLAPRRVLLEEAPEITF